jgi:hypothetical protein
MQESKDGKRHGNSFRMKRYDAAHEGKGPGPKAEAKDIEMPHEQEEHMEEQVHPGIHDEIKQIAEQHGPAHEVHVQHDHAGQMSHIHSVHQDGHEHHGEHNGPEHVMHAHHHAAEAAGVHMQEPENEGEGMAEHELPPGGDAEDFQAQPLD